MKSDILANLDNPEALERMYQVNKPAFERDFNAVYPTLKDKAIAGFWYHRLHYSTTEEHRFSSSEIKVVLLLMVVAGICAKLPEILSLDEEFFYTRNVGFLVFPFLTAYFAYKYPIDRKKWVFIGGLMLAGMVFINLLPNTPTSDTLVLSSIHLVLFLWAATGFAYGDSAGQLMGDRLGYLRFNGDLLVMSGLLAISGFITTGITIGLFSIIGFEIKDFYFNYIVLCLLPGIPLVGAFLTKNIPYLVQKISPVIARLFSPIVLVMLLVYLTAFAISGKSPYHDREFLMIFNALLVGVMALIFFSIAERSKADGSRFEIMVLFLLSAATIMVNSIALSAILFRISEWGITPNRVAVLGANVLMLANLMVITAKLVKVLIRDADLAEVGKSISYFLPIYWLWTAVVAFLFPFIFGFA